MITPQNARKEMFALVAAKWASGAGHIGSAASVAGYAPEIRYQGVEKAELPGSDKFWLRAKTTNVTTRQRGHQIDEPGVSKVVYDTFGFITLELSAPMKSPSSFAKGELLSELGQCMFMASETPGGVWFRNPRVIGLDNDGTWYRWDVIADYQFSQSKISTPIGLSVESPNDGLAIIGGSLRISIDQLAGIEEPDDGIGLDGSNIRVDIDSLTRAP